MHKVMTRAQHRPGTRPPARRDPRRPGATTSTRPAARPAARPAGSRPAAGPPLPRAERTTAPRRPEAGHPSATAARAATTPPPRVPAAGAVAAASPGGGRPTALTAPARPADNRPPAPGHAARRPVVPRLRPTDRFAELLVAVLSGRRPVHAMLGHTAGRAYDELVHLAERGPLRTRGARPVVRDIGWCEPREGAIEAFARIGAGDRLRAMAFRLELGRDLRWRCTAVELGVPRPHRAG
ncbi:Rv3235 family protein [Streptomyces calvus]|uniref:Rv3235 family protein n=1 Tax=Streptomyces calvus TaxID=67282 RepID=UPI003717DDCA